jgi:hypothetical protein
MRESATWDDILRTRWSTFVLASTLLVILCFATWGVLTHETMDVVLTGIAVPLTPALIWSLREFREQSDAARSIRGIHALMREGWAAAVSRARDAESLSEVASEIAWRLLTYRAGTSPVPNLLYRLLRPTQTTDAAAIAQQLLREYNRAV